MLTDLGIFLQKPGTKKTPGVLNHAKEKSYYEFKYFFQLYTHICLCHGIVATLYWIFFYFFFWANSIIAYPRNHLLSRWFSFSSRPFFLWNYNGTGTIRYQKSAFLCSYLYFRISFYQRDFFKKNFFIPSSLFL